MRKTRTALSDGRELIYFDHDDAPERLARDTRGLQSGSTTQGTMRRDPLTGQWVSVAGHRQTRTFLPSATSCPICPTTDVNLTEIPESSYQVVVFENRYPSFLDTDTPAAMESCDVLGATVPAHGRCEVVAFCDDHAGSIGGLNPQDMALVMAAWMDRTAVLGARQGIAYVFCFENRGAEVGVTLHHPHGQIYAYPYVPSVIELQLQQGSEYFDRTGSVMLDDIVAFEAASDRVIYLDAHWLVVVPFAARWPYEVHMHPLARKLSLDEITPDEQASFCTWYPRLIRALDALFDMPMPYMAGWHQRPANATAEQVRDSRLFMRLISNRRAADKLKFLASSESLMGGFINDIAPEVAAAHLRKAFEATP